MEIVDKESTSVSFSLHSFMRRIITYLYNGNTYTHVYIESVSHIATISRNVSYIQSVLYLFFLFFRIVHAITLIMYVNIDKVHAMAKKFSYNNYPRTILPKY